MTSGESVTVAADRKRPRGLAAMLRSQMRNIAPFLTLICLFGFFAVASPSFATLGQSRQHPDADFGHRHHRRRPHLRDPVRRNRSLDRRHRQRHRHCGRLFHAAGLLRQHRQRPDARMGRDPAGAGAMRPARPRQRVRADGDRHPLLHHDAGDDADRGRRLGAAGARADRLQGAPAGDDARDRHRSAAFPGS